MHHANGSVNRVLAWGHARVLENLLLQKQRMNPPPVRAISDQFASSTDTIQRALLTLGRDFQLVQRHRAEEDPAVAAASILARDEFVRRLHQLGSSFQITLPKGAAPQVEAAGRAFVAQHGPETLSQVAKMHFRTRYRILGLPEPPSNPFPKPPRRPSAP
jgi:ribonuclease HIII